MQLILLEGPVYKKQGVGIDNFLEKEIRCIIGKKVVFQDFLIGPYPAQGYLRVIIDKADICPDGVIDEPGIVGEIKVAAAPFIRAVEQMRQRALVGGPTDFQESIFGVNSVYVVIILPD